MAERRPLILDGGSFKELPSGDVLPVPLTKATLNHTAGVIDLDVAAANVFEFEADVYVSGGITPLSAVKGSGSSLDISSMGLLENDTIIVGSMLSRTSSSALVASFSTAGVDQIAFASDDSGSGTAAIRLGKKRMGAVPDTSLSFGGVFSDTIAIGFRGVDPVIEDVPASSGTRRWSYDTPTSNDTVTDGCYGLVMMTKWGGESFSFAGLTNLFLGAGDEGLQYISVDRVGPVNAGPQTFPQSSSWSPDRNVAWATTFLRPASSSGEKDYTLNLTNKPADVVKPLMAFLEVRTTAGSWNVSAIDEWIDGAPDLNVVGKHAIKIWANATLTVAEYKGLVA